MAKLIHVLGGGRWQLPTIQLAKSLGHRVLVTDMYSDRPAYALADYHEVADISDRERTLQIAQRHRIDGILCDTTDVGVPTAAFVAEKLGLPGMGLETALKFTNKYRMRTTLQAAGIGSLRFRLTTSLAEAQEAAGEVGYPLVLKPPDSQSSRGVHRVADPDEIEAAFADAMRFSRSGAVLAEQFLPGIEVTVEGFCLGGRYFTTGVSDKGHFAHRPEVANRLTYPAKLGADTMVRVCTLNEKIVRELGLTTGVTHAEYMVDGSDVKLVEIAARGGGSLIHSDIVPYLSGIDVMRAGIDIALGDQPKVEPHHEARAANLMFFEFASGRVTSIVGLDDATHLKGVHEILLEFKEGDSLLPPDDDRSRPGLMVVFGTSRDEVLATSEKAAQLLRVTVER